MCAKLLKTAFKGKKPAIKASRGSIFLGLFIQFNQRVSEPPYMNLIREIPHENRMSSISSIQFYLTQSQINLFHYNKITKKESIMFSGKCKPNMEKFKTWKTLYYNICLPGNDGPPESSMKITESILQED